MSKGLVLISGVNGYIGATLAKHILDNGYSVRGTVRNLSSAEPLLQGPLKGFADKGTFEVVAVPDITAQGAFDDAVKDVTSIAHLAAPISFAFTDPTPVLHAAITGTTTILNSALNSANPNLKSVVLMSSIAACAPNKAPPYTITEKDWNTAAEEDVKRLGKQTPGPTIYTASKAASEKAFWGWREQHKPKFAMATVNPVFVIGPQLPPPATPSSVAKTISQIYAIFSGAAIPDPFPGLPNVVDIRDVAALTLYLLSHPEETDGERYIASGATASHPQVYADIIRKAMPEVRGRVQEGKPGEGYLAGYGVDEREMVVVDAGKAGGLIGGWRGLEESVVDTAKSLLGAVSS